MGLTSLKLSHLFCGLSALAAGLFMPGFVGLTSLKLSRFIIGPFCRSLGPSVGPFFFLPPTLCPLSGSNLAGRSAHKTDWNLISLADVDSEGSLDRMQLVISRSVS